MHRRPPAGEEGGQCVGAEEATGRERCMENIPKNLQSVRDRIAAACDRADRDPGGVTLVAVTKTVGGDEIRRLYDLGVRDFGENRVQEGLDHAALLGQADARWHFIGHLQRNKAAAALAMFRRIHSVESPKLINVLDKECGILGYRAEIMLEVNVSREESKYGIAPGGAVELTEKALSADNLSLFGLMTMAPFTADPETVRPVFRGLRELRDRLADRFPVAPLELSMGMSGDFEVAIEEGATIVRVGGALFE
ncbi:MAG: YggS family pyridoxal phosphate-dependent enzyme [Planctomycetota bacterium]|jgi:pyridoxal phosphate enzyme (YggS family)|nr:YggS family pyridoxal phosphate-dependent enzyme [Planctomycetota bacterium]